jgi:hypothetical protein
MRKRYERNVATLDISPLVISTSPISFLLLQVTHHENQYWNWGRTASDPAKSPLFNGNMSSMSGNGAKVYYPGVKTSGFKPPYDVIPADEGGGCVTTGPFAKYVC